MNMNDKKLSENKEQDSSYSKRIVALLVKQLQIFAVSECIENIKIQEIHTLFFLRHLSFWIKNGVANFGGLGRMRLSTEKAFL